MSQHESGREIPDGPQGEDIEVDVPTREESLLERMNDLYWKCDKTNAQTVILSFEDFADLLELAES